MKKSTATVSLLAGVAAMLIAAVILTQTTGATQPQSIYSSIPARPAPGSGTNPGAATATPRPDQHGTPPAQPPPTVQPLSQQYPIVDCGSGFPLREKWSALVRRSDSTNVIVLMAPATQVKDMQACLSPGYTIIETFPSATMMGNAPPLK